MKIRFSHLFLKNLSKSPVKIKEAFNIRLHMLMKDKFHTLLRNHVLKGKWQDCRSINITGDWRAIFQENVEDDVVEFLAIGTHSQLY